MRVRLPVAVLDNTLLSRLSDLGVSQFLPFLFARVFIPVAVLKESRRGPGKLRRRVANLLKEQGDFFFRCLKHDQLTYEYLRADLHDGEAAVIAQGYQLRESETDVVLVIDENKGTERAAVLRLDTLRTSALLCLLKMSGAIPRVRPYLDHLRRLGYYISDALYERLLTEQSELE